MEPCAWRGEGRGVWSHESNEYGEGRGVWSRLGWRHDSRGVGVWGGYGSRVSRMQPCYSLPAAATAYRTKLPAAHAQLNCPPCPR